MKTISKIKLSIAGLLSICVLAAFTGPWAEFKTYDGLASTKFPAEPTISEQSLESAVGQLTMNMMMLEMPEGSKDPNLTYGMIYTDYPDSLIHSDLGDEFAQEFFKSAANGAAENVQGKVLSQESNKYQGYPGSRVKIDFGGEYVIDMQMYLVKNRTYMLQVICPSNKTENNVNLEQFFGSFKLLK